jgi:hypothetical protein
MSMWKDRKRSVGVSNWRSSPPRPVLTTARVGIYGYIHTIYIRRYGTRDTTLAPWIFKSHLFTGSQGHQSHRPQTHRATRLTGSQMPDPPGHRVTGLSISPVTIATMVLGSPSHRTNEPPATQVLGSQTHHLTGSMVCDLATIPFSNQ